MHKHPKRLCHWISKKRPESSLILFTLMTMIAIFPGSLPLEAVNVPVAEGRRHVTIQKPTVEGHDAAQVVGDAKTGFLVLYPSKPTGAADQSFTVEVIALLPQGMSEEDKKKVSARMIDEEGIIIVGGAPRAEGQTLKIELKVASPSSQGRLALTFDDKATDHPACNVNLLPVDLKVDANRDGEITGADQTTSSEPYRFWINSDTDTQEESEENPSTPDHSNNRIDTKRDLEDFTRLWFNIGALHEQLESGDAELGFKWIESSGSPSVNIYWAANGDGDDFYLEDDAEASAQLGGSYNTAVASVSGGDAVFIDKKVFANIDSSGGWVYFLFEGASEGKGKLTSVLKLSETESEAASVDLDVANIRTMYETVRATPVAGFSGWGDNSSEEPVYPPFGEVFGDDFIEDPQETAESVTFVHGWRMEEPDSRRFAETMFKRMWQTGFTGRFSYFRWPTYTGLYSYSESEMRALKYGESLQKYLTNGLPNSYEKNVVAHSLGTAVVVGAMRRNAPMNAAIFMQGAMPAGCFDTSEEINNEPYFQGLATPDLTEPELGYRGAVESDTPIFNFFNLQDFALMTGTYFYDGLIVNSNINTNWRSWQKFHKPDLWWDHQPPVPSFGLRVHYRYDSENPLGQRVYLERERPPLAPGPSKETLRYITDAEESMALLALPKSNAVGAVAISNAENYDLSNDEYGQYNDQASDHSGQFNRPIQRTIEVYEQLKEIIVP